MAKSWLPWSAIEQIPQGMALEITPWLNGRNPLKAAIVLHSPESRLKTRYPHLVPIARGPAILIWYPSKQAAEAIAKDALTDGRKTFPRNAPNGHPSSGRNLTSIDLTEQEE